jgi:hypothetical protein
MMVEASLHGPLESPRLTCRFAPWRATDGQIFEFFAFDCETTEIDFERPDQTPAYVIGAACDGQRGVFISSDDVRPFFKTHRGVPLICHYAPFDLRVIDLVLKPSLDIYEAVDHDQVWDTQVLKRLYSLATAGHTARGESSLSDCALMHLGVMLQKGQRDAQGNPVRTSFAQFLGKPLSSIPVEYLTYLAQDALATWHLFWELYRLIRQVLQNARGAYGYVSSNWLKEVTGRFGPLTHHIQLKASILVDVLNANGIEIDQAQRQEKLRSVQAILDRCKERMRQRGYLAGEQGNGKALQWILKQFHKDHPDIKLEYTPSGEQWSATEQQLAELAEQDEFFADYMEYKQAEKLLSTYLSKMGKPRLHAKFGYLLATGRTYCSGGFNLQNLPREDSLLKADPGAATIRGCFVPGERKVFIDCDLSQIESVVLGHVQEKQFGRRSALARLINEGQDVHRLIAAAVLKKAPTEVTKTERDSAKAVSFGRPGGMGAVRLQGIAKVSYDIDLTLEEVEQRIHAYHELCPELTEHLHEERDLGSVIAEVLHLIPAEYYQAKRECCNWMLVENRFPAGWLGAMLLKVLRDPVPVTQQGSGRPYAAEEINFFWDKAQQLPIPFEPPLATKLARRHADRQLWEVVRNWAGRRPVFTITGRLRAQSTFCSSRNCLFQGPAADGAILGLWLVWRADYKIVDFVHDQVVVESPADDQVWERAADIQNRMKDGMRLVVPGMQVKVETVITRSLNKKDLDPCYYPQPQLPAVAQRSSIQPV